MAEPGEARSRYIAIAAKRFADTGFHGASLAVLARDAGVSKQALLHFFGTKERLYAEVLTELSERLIAEIEAAPGATSEARLAAYFTQQFGGGLSRAQDARLVTRALLDSAPSAHTWPLKPYLDRLVDLLRQTRKWQAASDGAALAAIYRLIGTIQYFAISQRTLTGMYGPDIYAQTQSALAAEIETAVERLTGIA